MLTCPQYQFFLRKPGLTIFSCHNVDDYLLEQRFRREAGGSFGRYALELDAVGGSAENWQIAHDLKKYSADSEEIGMNNKKTAAIFSLVPRDRRSTQLVISTSTRRNFVRILLTSIYVITT